MHHETCDDCGTPQLARNTWFTGKLLTERDLTDEQRYLMGKLTRHNAYLHGSGIACGLGVVEHPNPACRAELVLVSPGFAVDCCGREILLTHEEAVPFAGLIEQAWRDTHGDEPMTGAHRVQLCVAHRECLTEDTESLLDPCDDSPCRPNRILDSYTFGARIDAPLPAPQQPAEVTWSATMGLTGITGFALDAPGDRLYALAGSTLMVFAASTGAVVSAHALLGAGLAIAISSARDRLFVAQAGTDAVVVLDTADLNNPVVSLAVPAAPAGEVLLAVPGAGGVIAVDVAAATAYGWDASAETGSDSTTSLVSTVTVGADPHAVAALPDSSGWVVACPDGTAHLVETGAGSATAVALGGDVVALAGVAAAGGEQRLLAIRADGTAELVSVDLTAGTVAPVGFGASGLIGPTAVAVSSDGGWAAVAGADTTGQGVVQVLDVALMNTAAVTAGPPLPVGHGPLATPAIDETRSHVLVAYQGGDPNAGVAVLDASLHPCGLGPGPCPTCEDDCLVLATVEGWEPGDEFTDETLGTAGRRHLPSVAAIADAVACLLARPTSGVGQQGPAGPTGATGPQGEKGDKGDQGDDGLQGEQGEQGERGETGEKGDTGDPGEAGTDLLAVELPRITGISWPHRDRVRTPAAMRNLRDLGVVVGFSEPVDPTTLDAISCAVYLRRDEEVPGFLGYSWIGLRVPVLPVRVETSCGKLIRKAEEDPPPDAVNGVRLPLGPDAPDGVYLVVLDGDAILSQRVAKRLDGSEGRLALDGNHLGPGLPDRCPTGDLIEGGRFTSWFILGEDKL